jgi:PIN domain nuclease of toxin-antitoxin system
VKVLLDTHCWLWSLSEPQKLNMEARRVLESADNEVYLSAASAWEIAIKHALGKLDLPVPPTEYVMTRLVAQRLVALPIQIPHALEAAQLPNHHKDPFDRLLVAQARTDRLQLLTADSQLKAYEVDLLWAA